MLTMRTHVFKPKTFLWYIDQMVDGIMHPTKTRFMQMLWDLRLKLKHNAYTEIHCASGKKNDSTIERFTLMGYGKPMFPIKEHDDKFFLIHKRYKADGSSEDAEYLLYTKGHIWDYATEINVRDVQRHNHYYIYVPDKSDWMYLSEKRLEKWKAKGKLRIVKSYPFAFLYECINGIYEGISTIGRWIYTPLHTIDSIYLSVKYPFLYSKPYCDNGIPCHYMNDSLISKIQTLYDDAYECLRISFAKAHHLPYLEKMPNVVLDADENVFYCENKENIAIDSDGITYAQPFIKDPIESNVIEYMVFIPCHGWHSVNKFKYDVDDKETIHETKILVDKKSYVKMKLYKGWQKIDNMFGSIPTTSLFDWFPEGWRRNFGLKMCNELKKALKQNNYLKEYHINDIKEKWSTLRVYDQGSPNGCSHEIIDKYEDISYKTCINCGMSAKYHTRGWIIPLCEDCISESQKKSIENSQKPQLEDN